MPNKEVLLDVRHLKRYFISGSGSARKETRAVDDVSFQVYRGETFGLVGESGCGKTTTGQTIVRLHQPTGGEIWFAGRRISGKLSPAEKRQVTRDIQMIFQDPIASLNPRMTIEEIVGEGLKVGGMRSRHERLPLVYDMLDKVGLTRDHATRYPHEFSGGQRQRIGIARALVMRPSLLIADEPVSALDVSIQAQIINLFNQIKQEMKLTMLFIAHDLSVVKYFSDRIGVMYGGRMVEMALAEELYTHPLHPYTRSLLSAIPQPDPLYEKTRKRVHYNPSQHPYQTEQPEMVEIRPDHFVLASPSEIAQMKMKLERKDG
jgi:ABC-type oligopeptide transport system ATPase subunit